MPRATRMLAGARDEFEVASGALGLLRAAGARFCDQVLLISARNSSVHDCLQSRTWQSFMQQTVALLDLEDWN
jgi:hypothetical protein